MHGGMRGQRGQIAPALMLVVMALLAAGMMLFQVGRATILQAHATTAADAAALAAAEDLESQLLALLIKTGFNEPEALADLDEGSMRAAAQDYAQRNDGRLVRWEAQGLRVYVEVETVQALDGDGGLPESAGRRGRESAWAEVEIEYAFAPPAASFTGGGGTVPAGVGGGTGNVEDYIGALDPDMQVAVARLDELMGGDLRISSGYRSAAYQAQLCQRVSGPCAPPGRSMHQYGLAIDVGNWQEALATLRAHRDEIALCHPLPENDAVHFSHLKGRECGGSQGTLASGSLAASEQFGGDVASYATFTSHLIAAPD